MTNDQREIRRKLRILEHAEQIGDVSKTCRYFGVGRASFTRWRHAYEERGEAGLANARSVPHNHPNKTPPEVTEKVLHLRRKYPLGPIRIAWYLERYHGIDISDAGVYRILKRKGLNRLPGGTRKRKVHTKRYNKQVPGHHIQMDVKFLTFKGKRGENIRRFHYTAIDDATRVRALKIYERHTQASDREFVASRRVTRSEATSSKRPIGDPCMINLAKYYIDEAQHWQSGVNLRRKIYRIRGLQISSRLSNSAPLLMLKYRHMPPSLALFYPTCARNAI